MRRSEAIGQLYTALHDCHEHAEDALLPIICGTMEDLRQGILPTITDINDEADWWASMASPIDMEAHLRAIDRHLPETPIHHKARKRIVAAMFLSLSNEDRAAFMGWAKEQTE